MQLLSALPSRTLLLIEDVDAAFVGRSEGEDSKGGRDAGRGNNLSFSGLLNALGMFPALAPRSNVFLQWTQH